MARFIFGLLIVGLMATNSLAEELPQRKSAGYGSPATNKPLPADPYAGNPGLSITELANPPGVFNGNPPLPSSVPSPVLPTSLNNMPLTPPFISPAFEPRTTPPPGISTSQSKR